MYTLGADHHGKGGTELEACPGFWRRTSPWPCARPWTAKGRIVYAHALEASEGLSHAWPHMLPVDLPGPLYDGVVLIWSEQRRAAEKSLAEAEERGKRSATPGMEAF